MKILSVDIVVLVVVVDLGGFIDLDIVSHIVDPSGVEVLWGFLLVAAELGGLEERLIIVEHAIEVLDEGVLTCCTRDTTCVIGRMVLSGFGSRLYRFTMWCYLLANSLLNCFACERNSVLVCCGNWTVSRLQCSSPWSWRSQMK